jgi:hypothetical protein
MRWTDTEIRDETVYPHSRGNDTEIRNERSTHTLKETILKFAMAELGDTIPIPKFIIK